MLQRFSNFYNEVKENCIRSKLIMDQYKDYLQEGDWYLVRYGLILELANKKEAKKKIKQQKLNIKSMLCRFIFGKKNIRHSVRQNIFCGNTMILSTHQNIKIFDYSLKEVLFLPNEAKKEVIIKNLEYFQKYINTTTLRIESFGIFEKYIVGYPRNEWSHNVLLDVYCNILQDFSEYFRKLGNCGCDCNIIRKNTDKCNSIDIRKLISDIKKDIEFLLDLPCIYCHGDLHFRNCLYDKECVYYIDFEDSRYDVFFYDFFNIMYVDIIENDDYYLLNMYLEKNDLILTNFKKAFAWLNVDFNEDDMIKYLKLFLLSRIDYDYSYRETGNCTAYDLSCYHKYNKFLSYIDMKTNQKVLIDSE